MPPFDIIPAVDILGGKCVRLSQGRFEAETIYFDSPLEAAKKWEKFGAPRLHLVDLNGAKDGTPRNTRIIREVIKSVKMKIQVGGGIRSMTIIEELLEAGADRVIMGTSALDNPSLIQEATQKHPDRVVVSLDSREGHVASFGWFQTSSLTTLELAKQMQDMGVKRVVYTDIKRDGMLTGPNFEGIQALISKVSLSVIASGGISKLEDIHRLKGLAIEGCVVGKALYTGAIQLEEALGIADFRG